MLRRYKNAAITGKKRFGFLPVCLFVACFESVAADDVATKKKALHDLQAEIKQTDAEVKRLYQQRDQLIGLLKQQDKHYGQLIKKIRELEGQTKAHKKELGKLSKKIIQIQQNINREKGELESLIKAAHAMGGHERIKVILNQQDPVLSSRILVYYDYLNKNRVKKLKKINSQLEQLQRLEKEQQSKKEVLEAALKKLKQEQTEVSRVRKERKQTLKKLKQQVVSKKAELLQLKRNESKLKQLIESLQRRGEDFPFQEGPGKPFAQLKGRLPWPLSGKIIKKFNSPRAESRWDGVLISAREGADIHAVTRGRIVYADWLRGYGLLTIIDHGKGYMTLYAFNQSLYKTEGDWVEAGDVIASVGNSGGRSQSALYFGIRRKGRPLNPQLWCRKLRHGKTR